MVPAKKTSVEDQFSAHNVHGYWTVLSVLRSEDDTEGAKDRSRQQTFYQMTYGFLLLCHCLAYGLRQREL